VIRAFCMASWVSWEQGSMRGPLQVSRLVMSPAKAGAGCTSKDTLEFGLLAQADTFAVAAEVTSDERGASRE